MTVLLKTNNKMRHKDLQIKAEFSRALLNPTFYTTIIFLIMNHEQILEICSISELVFKSI